MPWAIDSDRLGEGETIIVAQNEECPDCDTLFDVEFDTGAEDQDAMTDLVPGDITQDVRCPNCGHTFTAEYRGWVNYGDAG